MAIYHFSVKVVSRGKGASAVAKAAYISGEKIKNEYDGKTHDYRRKHEVVHKEILLPHNAPREFKKRSVLWNAVETAETRKNSQTAKHIDAALPAEISRAEQIDLVRQFCQQCFVSRGMCCDFAIHDKRQAAAGNPQFTLQCKTDNTPDHNVSETPEEDNGNPHVHILINTRRVNEKGFTTKDRSWNDKALLLEWRKCWEEWCNYKLRAVSDERIDCRSYKEQRKSILPQVHLGAAACAIEKKGYRTDKGDKNRKIQLDNERAEMRRVENLFAEMKLELRAINKNIIETALQCKLTEMSYIPLNSIPNANCFLSALTEADIPFKVLKNAEQRCDILFPRKESERVALVLEQSEKKKTVPEIVATQTPPVEKKKRRSL